MVTTIEPQMYYLCRWLLLLAPLALKTQCCLHSCPEVDFQGSYFFTSTDPVQRS